jgi:hypothetical protein
MNEDGNIRVYGNLTGSDQFFVDSIDDLARSCGLGDGQLSSDTRAIAWSKLSKAGFTSIGLPASAGGAASTLEATLAVEAFSRRLPIVPFVTTCVIAPRLLGLSNLNVPLDEIVNHQTACIVGMDTELRGAAPEPPSKRRRYVDVPTWPIHINYLALHGENLLLAREAQLAEGTTFDLLHGHATSNDFSHTVIGVLPYQKQAEWLSFALLMIAAELLGLMQGALDMAVLYASERVQFGKPIGSYQAIQHLLADAHVNTESVRSAVRVAATSSGESQSHLAEIAKYRASLCAIPVIETALQVHGGMGHTFEYPLHRYLRRAHIMRALFGDEHFWVSNNLQKLGFNAR